MSELKTNLEQILQEKTTKLIPENIKRKVEIFDVTGTDGDAEVEELQAKIIETRQEIADTRRDLENSAATVTGTGENVTLNQTAEATLKKLGVGGNTKQTQYSGKNLFKPIPSATRNGITFTNNEDGSYTLNGTATAPTSFYIVNVGYGSGTYALSANNPVTNSDVILQLETSNGNKNTALNAINKTLIDNCDDINALSIIVSNGTTLSNFIIKPQLELGSSATDFEPYTGGQASPSPDYPQEITNVTGDVEVVVENKNLLNISQLDATVQGMRFKGNEDNELIISGTYTGSAGYISFPYKYINLPTGTYTFTAQTNNIPAGVSLRLWTTPTNLNLLNNNHATTTQMLTGYTFALIGITNNTTYNIAFKIQLEYGSTATTYTPHKEQVFTFPLGNEKLMLGDYLADDGIHKNRKKIVLDGTSENKFSSFSTGANNRGAIAAFSDIKKGVDFRYNTALCTNFAYVPNVYFDSGDTEGFIVDSTGTIYVRFGSQSEINTLAKANQWLANTLPELEYELAEEVIVPYTSAQQEVYDAMKKAISYEEQTNVNSSNTVSPIFTVTAFKDADLAIASLDNRVTLLED